jgi:hypothetical protein
MFLVGVNDLVLNLGRRTKAAQFYVRLDYQAPFPVSIVQDIGKKSTTKLNKQWFNDERMQG